MGDQFDVIVVGVGAMGASACHHLARRGVRVLGLEQFDVPNSLGSSHGLSRMIRLAYYEHPDYVPMLRRAYELWGELEELSGEKLLYITGGLYLGRPGSELVEGSARSAREHSLPHEWLDRPQIAQRFGQFELPDDFVALFETRAGFLRPERVITAYARSAQLAGAQIHAQEQVLKWSEDSSGVRVVTNRGEYRAAQLIFCAGPWTSKILSDLRVRLVVTRQVMFWFSPSDPRPFALGKMPVWAIDRDNGGLYYGFPMSDDSEGVKVAVHAPGTPTDPDRVQRELLPGDVEEATSAVARYLPAAAGPILSHRVCLYTNSPDSHFIIDRHPDFQRVTLACGFSGHGFKFASVVGEVLADIAMDRKPVCAIEFLGIRRFLQQPA